MQPVSNNSSDQHVCTYFPKDTSVIGNRAIGILLLYPLTVLAVTRFSARVLLGSNSDTFKAAHTAVSRMYAIVEHHLYPPPSFYSLMLCPAKNRSKPHVSSQEKHVKKFHEVMDLSWSNGFRMSP